MKTTSLTVLSVLMLSTTIGHADASGADFSEGNKLSQMYRSGRVKQIVGGTSLALGLASFVAGVAIVAKEALPTPLGCFDCRATETKEYAPRLRPDLLIGGGIAIGLGAVATVGGAVTLALGTKERKASRVLSFLVAPTIGGASASAKLSF